MIRTSEEKMLEIEDTKRAIILDKAKQEGIIIPYLLLKFAYDYLGLTKGQRLNTNRGSDEFWLIRGWPLLEAKQKVYQHKTNTPKKKGMSPFSLGYWLEKGFTEEEAEYKRNSCRPIRKEYWLEKGFTEEEAIRKAKETKSSNDKKAAKKASELPNREYSSPRCKEHWIVRGFTEEEAIKKVSEVQVTFSKDICIKKHGEEQGVIIWKERQDKWVKTFKDMPDDKRELIYFSRGNANRGHDASDLESCKNKIKCIFERYPYYVYKPSIMLEKLFHVQTAKIHGFDSLETFIDFIRPETKEGVVHQQ